MDTTKTYEKRLAALRRHLLDSGLDGALLTSCENRRYYCGFTGGSGYLIVTPDDAALITDRRYTTQAGQQTRCASVIEEGPDGPAQLAETIRRMGVTGLVLESTMTLEAFLPLREKLAGLRLCFEHAFFLEQRMVKDAEEIACIRAAIAAAEAGFDKLLPRLKIGMTEKDLADELHYLVSREGAEPMTCGTIVGSGARGALAHGFPTEKKIENGDMVVVDFGVMKDGYCSDMTRTLLFGDVTPEHKRIFDLVQESQDRAIAAVRPGVPVKEVEAAHRAVFLREGLDDYALRSLGHGIGLEIHEYPRMVIGNPMVLRPGMVFTVEPGLYFPNDCGVRTEDDLLVTETGAENLSHTPHEIHID